MATFEWLLFFIILCKKITFYVDGFNFYYGLKRAMKSNKSWENYYWIDIVKLFNSFIGPNQELQKVIYFTASPNNPAANSRQSAFLNANKFINKDKFEVVRGKYLNKSITCPICSGSFLQPEEKKTDVNISIRMIKDCINNSTDSIVLVSSDSDLIPPLDMITTTFSDKKIKVYFTPYTHSSDILNFLVTKRIKPNYLEKNEQRFKDAIMPDNVGSYTIPAKWKKMQTI